MLPFLELVKKVGDLAQRPYAATGARATYAGYIKIWLNFAHDFLGRIYDYWNALQESYEWTTVADQERYFLPSNFDKPLSKIFDKTNDVELDFKTENAYTKAYLSSLTETGEPTIARIFGERSVRTQIASTGETIRVKSSNSADTQTIHIRGYIDSSKLIEDYETITLNGTTYATATSPKTFYEITQISKSDNTTGYITIEQSDGTVLGYLKPEEYVLRHKQVYLGAKIPDDEFDMKVLYKRLVRRMVQDYDFPFTECDNFLIYDAWGTALQQDKQESAHIFARAKDEMLKLIASEMGQLGPEYQRYVESEYMAAHRS